MDSYSWIIICLLLLFVLLDIHPTLSSKSFFKLAPVSLWHGPIFPGVLTFWHHKIYQACFVLFLPHPDNGHFSKELSILVPLIGECYLDNKIWILVRDALIGTGVLVLLGPLSGKGRKYVCVCVVCVILYLSVYILKPWIHPYASYFDTWEFILFFLYL